MDDAAGRLSGDGGEEVMTIDSMIEVLQAAKEGKAIQCRLRDHHAHQWTPVNVHDAQWNFSRYEYRVKPEPRTVWLVIVGSAGWYYAYDSEQSARDNLPKSGKVVKFIEVIE